MIDRWYLDSVKRNYYVFIANVYMRYIAPKMVLLKRLASTTRDLYNILFYHFDSLLSSSAICMGVLIA